MCLRHHPSMFQFHNSVAAPDGDSPAGFADCSARSLMELMRVASMKLPASTKPLSINPLVVEAIGEITPIIDSSHPKFTLF